MKEHVGQGVAWVKDGWRMFMRHPSAWPVLSGLWYLVTVLMTIVPRGGFVWWLFGPAVYAGFIYAAEQSWQGRTPEVKHLLAGFQTSSKRWAFFTLAAMTMLGYLVIALVLNSITGEGELVSTLQVGSETVSKGFPWAFVISVVLRLVLTVIVGVLLTSGLLYSAPLILFGEYDGIEALMTSAEKVWEHWRSLIVIGTLYAIAAGLGVLVFALPKLSIGAVLVVTLLIGAGTLVLAPVAYCASYVSFKALFGDVSKNVSEVPAG